MLTALASLVPGVGPRLAIWLTAAALIASTSAALFVAGELHGRAGKADAIAACNAKWTAAQAKAEKEYAETIAAAVADAAAVEPVGADAAALGRMCQQSLACRDRGHTQSAR